MNAAHIYAGSDGEATKRFYAELMKHGAAGEIAVNLFRAQKCSARAKAYRGGIRGVGSFRGLAYDRKQWAMNYVTRTLFDHGVLLGIGWGWKLDPAQKFHHWVLYVDLPTGQVSFHTDQRGAGPDYAGDWDGQKKSAERIIAFCDQVLTGQGANQQSLNFSIANFGAAL